MHHPVGALAVKIWRDGDGEIRARVETKLDVADGSLPRFSHHTSVAAVITSVESWLREYDVITAGPPQRTR
jgi:hypothetical protein